MSDNQDKLKGLHEGQERIAQSPTVHSEPTWGTASQVEATAGAGAVNAESNAEKLAKLQDGQPSAFQSPPSTSSTHGLAWGTGGGDPGSVGAAPKSAKKRNGILIGIGGLVVILIAVGLMVTNSRNDDSATTTVAPVTTATEAPNTVIEPPVAPDPAPADLFEKPASIPETVARVTASTAFLECSDNNYDYSGSGFVLNPTALTGSSDPFIVTNEHVVADCATPLDVTIDGWTYQGTVRDTDKEMDLAIIDVNGLTATPLKVALDPQIGEWVMTLGAPEGITGTSSFGTITNYKADEYLITTDAVIGHGSSGGPLLNSREEVFGVNSAFVPDSSGIAIAMSLRGLCVSLLACK